MTKDFAQKLKNSRQNSPRAICSTWIWIPRILRKWVKSRQFFGEWKKDVRWIRQPQDDPSPSFLQMDWRPRKWSLFREGILFYTQWKWTLAKRTLTRNLGLHLFFDDLTFIALDRQRPSGYREMRLCFTNHNQIRTSAALPEKLLEAHRPCYRF